LEMPRTLRALAAASAAAGDVFLGLLQTVLAIMVPNGSGIQLGVQVDADGDPVVFNTHGAGHNVFWSYATVSGRSVCTVTLMIAIFASVQNVPFVCVHPIGSYILGRGGNITIGNYACRAGRIGRRRMELNAHIRDAHQVDAQDCATHLRMSFFD
jgi:hypothetical protein